MCRELMIDSAWNENLAEDLYNLNYLVYISIKNLKSKDSLSPIPLELQLLLAK